MRLQGFEFGKNSYIVGVVICSVITLISFIYAASQILQYDDIFDPYYASSYSEVYIAIFICIVGIIGLTVNILNISKLNNETNSSIPEHKPTTTTKTDDNIAELVKYKDLLDKGIISKEEFEEKKKQLLGL